jgi:hypothetical protein
MIVSHLVEAVLISALGLLLRWENKKRDKIQSAMEGGLEGRDLGATAFLDLTDRENLKYVFPVFSFVVHFHFLLCPVRIRVLTWW